ncbi:MAG TPA: NADP-dependent phosphogluconate dehydrogenase [Sphingobacteriaceae bacterium]
MIVIVMGVSGSGKTTIGQMLAAHLKLPFYDADDFHLQFSIEKMRNGIPLTDHDRIPWLSQLGANIERWEREGGAVLACSALKERYREMLQTVSQINWVYLNGSRTAILERLQARKSHYMPPALLDSQLEALEEPAYGIHADISSSPDEIAQTVISKLNSMIPPSEFGIVGLGVMGKSLALNLADKGASVSVYNRHVAGKEEAVAEKMVAENPAFALKGFDRLDEFVQSISKPRKVLLMIYAAAIDAQIDELLPLLEPGDVIIDGGNSYYKDTARRAVRSGEAGIHYVGTGISGGEQGARNGPSIMPGGTPGGYELVAKYLNLIAARDKTGKPCAAYIGPDGAGHFVKMVHNGIEYAEMQALAEAYSLLRQFLQMKPDEIADHFCTWQTGESGSYLLEITIDILRKREGDELLLDKIRDQAEQKGTGGLSVSAALEYGVPYSSLSEAVMARSLSAMKERRVEAANLYQTERNTEPINKEEFLDSLKKAYQAARIINHEIGFNLMMRVSEQHHWQLDFSEIARIWTNGCIIRSGLMEELTEILKTDRSILTSPTIVSRMQNWQKDLAYVVGHGLQQAFALPVLSSGLNYFLSYTTAESPANLIQAQRDYFGAHRYQRKDKPAEEYFHTVWKTM